MSNAYDPNDRGTGSIDNGDPQTVTLSGREYERYLDGALNDPPPKDPHWSPHIIDAAQVMYKRLNLWKDDPRWTDLDIDAKDHYCIAAKLTVDAYHTSASGGHRSRLLLDLT